jgi:elongation factor P
MDGKPYEVIEASFSRMQQRKAVVQTRLRDLSDGKIVERTFQASDEFEEADISKQPLSFLYSHRGEYVFSDPDNARSRFSFPESLLGDRTQWLKPGVEVTALFFNEKLLTLILPIKIDYKVVEAPPGVQGDRSQSGTKTVTLETGIKIQAPLFINASDTVRVNTETGTYVERTAKAP